MNKKARKTKTRAIYISILFCLVVMSIFTWKIITTERPPSLPAPPLKQLAAADGIQLGNFAIRNYLNNKMYAGILTSQFSFALADNTPNWYFTDGGLRPTKNTYYYAHMDEVVHFAQAHHMPVQAHHYVWGEQKWLPTWLLNGHYSPQQLMDIMHDHILTVGRHYQGQIAEWSVVNEAFTREEHVFGLSDWWADHTGGDQYIDSAFLWARQADPNSKLILNDFDNETESPVANAMYSYIKGALARGIPIDGIGMQMHIDGTHPPSKSDVIKNMKRFGDLGISVYVTEFDVNMNDVKASDSKKDELEGQIYYNLVRACIESQVCHSFAFLGITDKESWYNYFGLPDARPLMFNKKYQPKPAYFDVRAALQAPT